MRGKFPLLTRPWNLLDAICRCLSLIGSYQLVQSLESLPALEHLSLSGWGLPCLRAGAAAALALQTPALQTLQCDDRLYWDECNQVTSSASFVLAFHPGRRNSNV